MTDNLLWFRNLILFITPITQQNIVTRESRMKVIHTINKNLHVALDYTCYMISCKRLIYLSLFYILKFTMWKDATEKKFSFISRSWEPIKWPILPFSHVRETLSYHDWFEYIAIEVCRFGVETSFGLYQKSHLFTMLLFDYFMILPTCAYFLKNIYNMGRLSVKPLEQVKGCKRAKLFLVLLQLKKLLILSVEGTSIPQLS